MQQQISKMAADINQHFDRRFKRALSVPPRGQVQSLRAFRRPKLGELELPGFQNSMILIGWHAEGLQKILSVSPGSLWMNVFLIRRARRSIVGLPRSSQRSTGALFSSSLASLERLLRNLGVIWETLRHCLATFWGLLAVLREKIIPIWMQDCQKPTQAGDCVPRENTTKPKVFLGLL